MKFLVTGGAGFIGSHIVDELISRKYSVIVLDNLSTGSIENINSEARFFNVDLSKECQQEISSFFKGVDIVFHCAALPNVQYSIEFPHESNISNVNSIINVLEAMRKNNVKRIVYSGSCSVYGNAENIPTTEQESINPLSPYALQKYICEEYCYLYNNIYNIQYMILRYFNVYGERMSSKGAYVSVISRFLRSIANNESLNIVNDGSQKRDFVYVKDVVDANICAALATKYNKIFNVGSGKNISVNEIANCFPAIKKYGEKRIEPKETLADIRHIQKELLWQPKQDIKEWISSYIKSKWCK